MATVNVHIILVPGGNQQQAALDMDDVRWRHQNKVPLVVDGKKYLVDNITANCTNFSGTVIQNGDFQVSCHPV